MNGLISFKVNISADAETIEILKTDGILGRAEINPSRKGLFNIFFGLSQDNENYEVEATTEDDVKATFQAHDKTREGFQLQVQIADGDGLIDYQPRVSCTVTVERMPTE